MDPIFVAILLIVAVAIVASVVAWRRKGRSLTPEEQLEQAALRAEQDRVKTEQMYRQDRYNLRD